MDDEEKDEDDELELLLLLLDEELLDKELLLFDRLELLELEDLDDEDSLLELLDEDDSSRGTDLILIEVSVIFSEWYITSNSSILKREIGKKDTTNIPNSSAGQDLPIALSN